MSSVILTTEVPEALVERARAVGVPLDAQSLEFIELLEAKIRRQEAFQHLDTIAEKLQSLPAELKPTPEEISAEIRAYWAAQTQKADSGDHP